MEWTPGSALLHLGLLHAAALRLGVFLTNGVLVAAGFWPLSLWLSRNGAAEPVAQIFYGKTVTRFF